MSYCLYTRTPDVRQFHISVYINTHRFSLLDLHTVLEIWIPRAFSANSEAVLSPLRVAERRSPIPNSVWKVSPLPRNAYLVQTQWQTPSSKALATQTPSRPPFCSRPADPPESRFDRNGSARWPTPPPRAAPAPRQSGPARRQRPTSRPRSPCCSPTLAPRSLPSSRLRRARAARPGSSWAASPSSFLLPGWRKRPPDSAPRLLPRSLCTRGAHSTRSSRRRPVLPTNKTLSRPPPGLLGHRSAAHATRGTGRKQSAPVARRDRERRAPWDLLPSPTHPRPRGRSPHSHQRRTRGFERVHSSQVKIPRVYTLRGKRQLHRIPNCQVRTSVFGVIGKVIVSSFNQKKQPACPGAESPG